MGTARVSEAHELAQKISMACLHIIFGPIGAGKSTFAKELSRQRSAIKFSTDEWFRNLFFEDMIGMPELDWTFERISRCEVQIWSIAKQTIQLGHDVVFDLGLQKIDDRDRIRKNCNESNIEHQFYYVNADAAQRQERVKKRNEGTGETFEFQVSPKMFKIANNMFEFPASDELTHTTCIDTTIEALEKQ